MEYSPLGPMAVKINATGVLPRYITAENCCLGGDTPLLSSYYLLRYCGIGAGPSRDDKNQEHERRRSLHQSVAATMTRMRDARSRASDAGLKMNGATQAPTRP